MQDKFGLQAGREAWAVEKSTPRNTSSAMCKAGCEQRSETLITAEGVSMLGAGGPLETGKMGCP